MSRLINTGFISSQLNDERKEVLAVALAAIAIFMLPHLASLL